MLNLELKSSPTNSFDKKFVQEQNYFRSIVFKEKFINERVSPSKECQIQESQNMKKRSVNKESPKRSIFKMGIPTSPSCTNRENCSKSFPNFQGSPLRDAMEGRSHKQRRYSQGSESPQKQSPYAGAKFGDAPAPRVLPLPPSHWIAPFNLSATQHLKNMLQIQA